MRRLCAILMLAMIPAATLAADAVAPGGGDKPLSVSVGPTDGGQLGATIKGAAYHLTCGDCFQHTQSNFPQSSYVELDPDVNFSTGANNNHGAISGRLTFEVGYLPPPPPPTSHSNSISGDPYWVPEGGPWLKAYVDARRQYGDFTTSAGASQKLDSTLIGGAVGVTIPHISRLIQKSTNADPFGLPMITVSWYHPIDHTSTTQTLPSGITANQIDASVKFALPLADSFKKIAIIAKVKPRFDFAGDLSRPTAGAVRKWKSKIDTALTFNMNGTYKPVISYTSGQKLGLKYDKQILLGLAMELFRAQ